MVLGHYFYGNLLGRIKTLVEKRRGFYRSAEKNGDTFQIKSWIDAFILGDIYVLGLDFNLAEIDLWWLLNRKANEKASHGNVYFFEPKSKTLENGIDERLELLKIFIAKENVIHFDEVKALEQEEFYRRFYEQALVYIHKQISQ